MRTQTFLLLSIAITFAACGHSKEEAAAIEKAKMDSVAQATEQNLIRQNEIQDSTDLAAATQDALKLQLIDLKGQLAGEESKLRSIAEYQLLRSSDEKAAQISEQTKIVEELRSRISDIERHTEK